MRSVVFCSLCGLCAVGIFAVTAVVLSLCEEEGALYRGEGVHLTAPHAQAVGQQVQ